MLHIYIYIYIYDINSLRVNDGSILAKIQKGDQGDTAIVLNPFNIKSEGGFTLHM